MSSVDFDLYLVTDRKTTGGRELTWVLEQALEGGVRAVQLREKDLGGRELLELAREVKRLCDRYGAELFINDRVDVALASDAAGVHLAANALPVKVARELLGPDRKIGVSTHSVEEARAASEAAADFVLFGPIYATDSKLAFGEPQGPAALKTVTDSRIRPGLRHRRHQATPPAGDHGPRHRANRPHLRRLRSPGPTGRGTGHASGAAGMTETPHQPSVSQCSALARPSSPCWSS